MTTTLHLNIKPKTASNEAKGDPKPGDPGYSPNNKVAQLVKDDGVLELIASNGDFGSTVKIAAIEMYDADPYGRSPQQVGTWTRTDSTTGTATGVLNGGAYSVSTANDNQVSLANVESLTSGQEVARWYKVQVTGPNPSTNYWWLDPEVINKAGGKNGPGVSTSWTSGGH